ncbi:hypothetical protein ACH47X_04250 [Promicromonospora kroppenstedtii]|uniref:Ribosomally synthesized peptide with SipW-like signal peptide n=1 Tax=Promicromonospora kroppenstedtii TaxID=440482 RepID=A0ABW7XFS2_9MICO
MSRVRRAAWGRALSVLLLAAPLAAVAGIAFAFWTVSGGGTGTGVSSTVRPVVLTPATPTADLYPGQRADVVLTVANPNAAAAAITALRLDTTRGDGGLAVDPGHAGCPTAALSYETQTNDGIGWTVPGRNSSGDGQLSITLRDALAMRPDAADACQGAVFTVFLAAGP